MDDRNPGPEDAADKLAVPPQFFLPATVAVFLLVLLLFAMALPSRFGLPTLALSLATRAPSPVPTVLQTPTSQPLKVLLPTPTLTPTITPTPVPLRYKVANTGGDGAAIRPAASRASPLLWGWAENTVVEEVGAEVTGDGLKWKQVRDPKGNVGYMLAQYLVPLPAGG